MTEHTTGWQAVGQAIVARRADMGMTQVDLARAAAISDLTVRRLETGHAQNYRTPVRRAMERALRWRAGSIDRILAGGEPVELAPVRQDEGDAAPPRALLAEHARQLVALTAHVERIAASLEATQAEVAALRADPPRRRAR